MALLLVRRSLRLLRYVGARRKAIGDRGGDQSV